MIAKSMSNPTHLTKLGNSNKSSRAIQWVNTMALVIKYLKKTSTNSDIITYQKSKHVVIYNKADVSQNAPY